MRDVHSPEESSGKWVPPAGVLVWRAGEERSVWSQQEAGTLT